MWQDMESDARDRRVCVSETTGGHDDGEKQ